MNAIPNYSRSSGLKFPWWLNGKEFTCNAGDQGSIPGLARSPEEGNGKPLQYSCLGNPMDRGAWSPGAHEPTRLQRVGGD